MALYQNPYGFNSGMMQQPQPYATNQQTAQTAQNNGITWVQGIEGAKAFQMVPNSNALLMDSENNGKMYIKTCDNIGMCTLRYFNYSEIPNSPTKAEIDTSQFVTKTELSSIINEINALKEGLTHEQSVPAAQSTPKLNTNQRQANDFKH